jgi:hypothetical protein
MICVALPISVAALFIYLLFFVIPAKAGIHASRLLSLEARIPAFAGMTEVD